MKKTRQCPKCDGLDLYYIAAPLAPTHDTSSLRRGASLGLAWADGEYHDFNILRGLGELEAYCCATCGYLETYVKDWEKIQADGKFIVRLSPPTGSYR